MRQAMSPSRGISRRVRVYVVCRARTRTEAPETDRSQARGVQRGGRDATDAHDAHHPAVGERFRQADMQRLTRKGQNQSEHHIWGDVHAAAFHTARPDLQNLLRESRHWRVV